MIEYKMTAPDIDRQIELLKLYPEVVVKYYRPALVEVTTDVKNVIYPKIPVGVTGMLADTFGAKVTGRAIHTIKGQVGWGKKTPYYAKFVEKGTAAHKIATRNLSYSSFMQGKSAAKSLRWMDGGVMVFAKSVEHPGTKAQGFMAAGWAATKPIVETKMQAAGNSIVKELAVP